MLRIEHLGRRVAGKVILDDISFDVREGELLAIVGPSGSGKTSLLRLLNRLDEPSTGTVYLEGKDYREIPARELRRQIGMAMQRPYLFPGTVASNIRFGPLQAGEHLDADAVSLLLAQVDLEGYADRDVAALSGGEAQRVSLARAVANRPRVLLLDEPTSALHEDLKLRIEALILKISRENHLTCVLVTHDTTQAARLAVRVAVVDRGRLAGIGTPDEVLHAEPDH